MKSSEGTSIKGLKNRNKTLILKIIATDSPISRVEIARQTGLAKMTVGNLVSELIDNDYITEFDVPDNGTAFPGRKPSMLHISPTSPCICGMLVKRGLCQVVFSDLSGNIVCSTSEEYAHSIDSQWLIETLSSSYDKLRENFPRKILAIGISSIGPLNAHNGTILAPPFFFNIENIPITDIISDKTGLPVFLINDANAGALAEKLYGIGKSYSNFAYLHIMNGIGAGFILDNKLYNGPFGRSGEIGHTSINFSGPKCTCGNVGCLELYANLEQMQNRIRTMSPYFSDSPLAAKTGITWHQILQAAGKKDPLAISALEEFCGYISYALLDALNLLDLSTVIVGYDAVPGTHVIEDLLCSRLSGSTFATPDCQLEIIHSHFNGDAPLIGAIAAVVDQIFSMNLLL